MLLRFTEFSERAEAQQKSLLSNCNNAIGRRDLQTEKVLETRSSLYKIRGEIGSLHAMNNDIQVERPFVRTCSVIFTKKQRNYIANKNQKSEQSRFIFIIFAASSSPPFVIYAAIELRALASDYNCI